MSASNKDIVKNLRVDFYLNKITKWKNEIEKLRSIMLDCGLTEEFKWGKPCYTYNNTNILLIANFKEHCALMLFKGAMLKDPNKILIRAGENTQLGRQIRFTKLQDIIANEKFLKEYILDAIQIEELGLKAVFKKPLELVIPEEFQTKLNSNTALKKAFTAFTPGRQRAYIIYFSEPKQSKTKEARIDKCIPQILAGIGLHDEYRKTK